MSLKAQPKKTLNKKVRLYLPSATTVVIHLRVVLIVVFSAEALTHLKMQLAMRNGFVTIKENHISPNCKAKDV